MQLNFAIVTSGLPLDHPVVGGSETAVRETATALAALGDSVKVFCQLDQHPYGMVDRGVEYLPLSQWPHLSSQYEFDVVIINREASRCDERLRANLVWLWHHDTISKRAIQPYLSHIWQVDTLFFLSMYQAYVYARNVPAHSREHFCRTSFLTTNGLNFDEINAAKARNLPRHPFHFVYTSRPERGLFPLLTSIWPRIKKKLPQAELHVASYSSDSLRQNAIVHPETKMHIDACQQLLHSSYADRYHVIDHGALDHDHLYQLLCTSNAWLYPTFFPEISCIALMEAMACGCLPITTHDFALPETFGAIKDTPKIGPLSCFDDLVEGLQRVLPPKQRRHGWELVKGTPDTAEYEDAFVQCVLNSTKHAYEGVRDSLQSRALEFTWDRVARTFHDRAEFQFAERSRTRRRAILQNLWYHDDLLAIHHHVQSNEATEDEKAEWEPKLQHAFEQIQHVHHYADAVTPLDHPRCQTVARMVQERASQLNLSPTSTVLDVAAGNGALAYNVLKHFPAWKAVLCDLVPGTLDNARQLAEKLDLFACVTFVQGDLAQQPEDLRDDYDVVLCGEFLEHVLDPCAVIRRLGHLCREGGLIVLTVPNGPWESEARYQGENRPTFHVSHFTIFDLQRLLGEYEDVKAEYQLGMVNYRGDLCGNWIVSWVNRKALIDRTSPPDYAKKVFVTRPYESVAVCLIAKDAETSIGHAIGSARAVADEILVNDTGSTDRTVSLAKAFGAKVIQTAWQDDFSAARNLVIDEATADWLFFVDTDEIVMSPTKVVPYLSSSFYHGFAIEQRHLASDEMMKSDFPTRIFRRHPGIRYVGALHEQPEWSESGQPLAPTLVIQAPFLLHFGYTDERTRVEKLQQRNLRILNKELKARPHRPLNWFLYMRDQLNFFKWAVRRAGGQRPALHEFQYLFNIIQMYHKKKCYQKQYPYHSHAFDVYQAALRFCAMFGVRPPGAIHVPFEMLIGARAHPAGIAIPNEPPVTTHRVWFFSVEELQRYCNQLCERVREEIGDESWYVHNPESAPTPIGH